MFIHAALDLPVPVASAVGRLFPALGRHRLDELSDDAYAAGLVALARVGPFGDVAGLSKTVRLELLDPLPVDDGVRLQLRWVATGVTGQLFPALDADLDIIAVDEQRCVLSIKAVYTPPLGAAGAGIDRLLLHRAARATMGSLLRGLGRSLTDPSPAAPPRAHRLRLGPVRFFPTAPVAPIAEV
jgi:hypothetical protein